VFSVRPIGELGLDEQAMLLKAIEEKRFFPVGSDKEIHSDFQLIAGTNRDLRENVRSGRFREDLLARINLWAFRLPPLHQRPEDIEPNIDYELERNEHLSAANVRFNAEARNAYLRFAMSSDGVWAGNFRELSASIARMATLCEGGRIGVDLVDDEIARLKESWRTDGAGTTADSLAAAELGQLDLFDQLQLQAVARVCQSSRSLADAGRKLFAVSRLERRAPNDSDRLRKYLARFGLDWERVAKRTW
jgi:transcriptional regulatory protein RtcR